MTLSERLRTWGGQSTVARALRERMAASLLWRLRRDPTFPARYLPLAADEDSWSLLREPWSTLGTADDGLPVPAQDLWAGYANDPAHYLRSGRAHHEAMMTSLSGAGFDLATPRRILDLGCAAGRMLRCFHDAARTHELWGADISARHVAWCRQHLSPPFRFVTLTTYPHLPFEDASFDLVYASSVFTHIGDLEDAWLLEVRRILRPGGLLWVSVHDEDTIATLRDAPPGDWLHDTPLRHGLLAHHARTGILDRPYGMFLTSREPGNTQVFHHSAYIRREWGRFFELRARVPGGSDYQTAYVLEKRPLAPG